MRLLSTPTIAGAQASSQAGFTLPEIMITLAVVGLLAMIAIPNYQAYSARSRQAEAKTSLTAIYTAEANFAVSAQTYTSCLTQIGVQAPGDHYYGCGMFSGSYAQVSCGPPGTPNACNYYGYDGGAPITTPTAMTCAATDTVPIQETRTADGSFPTASMVTNANSGPLSGDIPGSTFASTTVFTAGCVGNVSPASVYDAWSINNAQSLTNVKSGTCVSPPC